MTESFELNGWWLTGDVARKDAEGNFYHLDRTVDVIDTASGAVYSLELEEILLADCAEIIRDGVVVGVPARDGVAQEPIAVVQLQAGAEDWTPEAILDRANKELADRGLHPLAAVSIAKTAEDYPLGPTGKVLKRQLRTKFASVLGR